MLRKLARRLRTKLVAKRVLAALTGKDYIRQKPDGTLYVDGVELDRDELNAMTSWQDLVDMGVSKKNVGRIARDYGGHPKDVDIWLENNSRPWIDPNQKNIFKPWSQAIKDYVAQDLKGMYGDATSKMKPLKGHREPMRSLGKSYRGNIPGYPDLGYFVRVTGNYYLDPDKDLLDINIEIFNHQKRHATNDWRDIIFIYEERPFPLADEIDWNELAEKLLDKSLKLM